MFPEEGYGVSKRFSKALTEDMWDAPLPIWVLNHCGEVVAVNPFLEALFQKAGQSWQMTRLSQWIETHDRHRSCLSAFSSQKNEGFQKINEQFLGRLMIEADFVQSFSWHLISDSNHSQGWCWGLPADGMKEARSPSRDEHELLLNILDHSIDGMITIDTEGIILSFNRAAERLFIYAPEEVLGKNVSMLMPSPHRENHDGYIESYLSTGEAKIIGKGREVMGLRKDGTQFPFLLTTTKPFRIGSKVGFLGIVRDLSQTKNIENQLRNAQKMESLGTLAGGIAHDFNNILGGLSGYIELMLEDASPGSTLQEDLLEMGKACQRGRELVLQILTFSRRDRTAFAPMQLQPIVKESIKLLRATLPATINVVEDISPDCPPIMGDVTQIHQVLMNLGTNAFHAMRGSGGTLTVSLQQKALDHDTQGPFPNLSFGLYNCLMFSDTGHGIKSEHLARIFDPFFTTKPVGDGTGMGLAMVHGIIQAHKGGIAVESTEGHGSCFFLFFPQHIEKTTIELETETYSDSRGREHVMLVDDDSMLLRVQSRILRRAGYRVSAFENANQAFEAFSSREQDFDLLVTDQTMPGMTGLELSSAILDQEPEFPIILTTGFSESVSKAVIEKLGIRALLMKPVAKKDLTEEIRLVLDNKK